MVKQEDGFFVGINNPLDVRRNVLECSREMVQTLQTYSKVNAIREAKIKRIQQLKTVIRELDLLFVKLKSALPKTHLRAKVVEQGSAIKTRDLKDMTALEKLETQLKDIEQEIARIS